LCNCELDHKSFGKPFVTRKKQKPDATFRGTTNLVSFGLAAGERKTLNFRAQPQEFDAAFEISAEQLSPEKYATYVYVDLVQPGTSLS
jgi:hypothetical protein